MREATFVCLGCNQTFEQTRRGGRLKKRCAECNKTYKLQYQRDYYVKNKKSERVEA